MKIALKLLYWFNNILIELNNKIGGFFWGYDLKLKVMDLLDMLKKKRYYWFSFIMKFKNGI